MKIFWEACACSLVLFHLTYLNAQSTDGWHVRRSPLDEHLYSVTHGEGLYVAVGNNRTVLTSPNGKSWTVRLHSTNSTGWLCGIAHGNGTFVAVGNGFQPSWLLSSPSTHGPPGSAGFSVNSNAAPILVSENGIHWRPRLRGRKSLSAVAFGRGRFVAVGLAGLVTSRDGRAWFHPTNFYNTNGELLRISPDILAFGFLPPAPSQIAFGNGVFLVRSWRGAAVISTNGIDWVFVPSLSTFGSTLNLLGFARAMFLAPGPRLNEDPSALSGNSVFLSRSATEWSEVATLSFRILAFGRGHHGSVIAAGIDVAGDGWIQTSPNGLDWSTTPASLPGAPFGIDRGPRGVVVVGANGLIVHSPFSTPANN